MERMEDCFRCKTKFDKINKYHHLKDCPLSKNDTAAKNEFGLKKRQLATTNSISQEVYINRPVNTDNNKGHLGKREYHPGRFQHHGNQIN